MQEKMGKVHHTKWYLKIVHYIVDNASDVPAAVLLLLMFGWAVFWLVVIMIIK